jgi:DNA repair protein RadA/Sms
MTKETKIQFICQQCGYYSPKWLGKCPDCGSWNSFVEEVLSPKSPSVGPAKPSSPISIAKVDTSELPRLRIELAELDRVLGGGLVPGSVVLIGGTPGIGKSTLTLQALFRLTRKDLTTLYISAEESAPQIKLRAERLKVNHQKLYLLIENNLEHILKAIQQIKAEVVVIDSIQAMSVTELASAPGSISQIREVTAQLVRLAKTNNISIFIIGHVTKEGAIAGPKVLEHIVDTVLYFEGERGHPYRILRAVKNRFGPTNEIGVFEMREMGLTEVKNPSEFFLAERPLNTAGSVVVPVLEGSRPILVEFQALTTSSFLAAPRRTSIGVDPYRFNLLVTILEKRAGLNLSQQDIFFNVAGGVKTEEPAADLGIVTALASSFLNKAVGSSWIFLGEVGLSGEIRTIAQPEIRLLEAEKLGFKQCLIPKGNLKHLKHPPLNSIGVSVLKEAFKVLF